MKIANGALVVIKYEKIGKLYKLFRNTITSGVATSSLVELDNDNKNL
jgi:hypothetical protein